MPSAEDMLDEADELGEQVDAFRERLIAADVDDSVVESWRAAAIAVWEAVALLEP